MTAELQWSSDCSRYQNSEVRGYCLMKVASSGHGPESADTVCDEAGSWEADCRQAWATSRARDGMTDQHGKWMPSQWSTQDLLSGCAENEDCRFAILDARPEKDPVEQMRLCDEFAGKYGLDCAMHALDRWTRSSPDLESIQAVANQALFPVETGRYIAIFVACKEIGTCQGNDAMSTSCTQSVASIRANPAFCEDWTQSDTIPPSKSLPAHENQ
ncbi:MAG: hypothetical protein VX519_12795 [Myxococcota bacterium]|nr:hypothetical protein [Myxococcota bacterium]